VTALSSRHGASKSPRYSALTRSARWLAGEALGTQAELADQIYEWRKSPATLDSAIAAYRRAAAVAPVGSSEYTRCLGNLAVCLRQRFSATEDLADLDAAIACGRQAVNGTSVLSSSRAWIMANLAAHLNRRWDESRDPADLEASVFFASASARETSPWKRKDAAKRWQRLADYAFEKYHETGNEADIHTAVSASRKAVAATPSGASERAGRLATLSATLVTRYTLTQEQADLDEAAAVAAEAEARLPVHNPDDRAWCLRALTQVHLAQFDRSGQVPELERAVETARRAVACQPTGNRERAGRAVELTMALVRLYETTGAPVALDEAQTVTAEAVALADEGSTERHMALAARAAVRRLVYEQTGQFESLETAAEEAREAVAALPAKHSLRYFALSTMGTIDLWRYERTRDQVALADAITALQQAVEAGGRGHYLRPGWLSTLGMCLGQRFQRTGNAADLDDAIDLLREAATTSTAYSHAPLWLNNLCIFLRLRFHRTEDRADLDEAISAARRAVDMSGAGALHRAIVLSNLGTCLITRHHSRFRQADDIDDAVDAMRAAVAASQPGHADYPKYLMNLGLAHSARSSHGDPLPDAEAAVRYCREALSALPDDHGNRGIFLGNLSESLGSLAGETGDRADAAEALDIAREALAQTPPDHPDRERHLRFEGDALETSYTLDGDPSDLRAAFASWRAAVSVAAADPSARLRTARYWGRAAARRGMIEDAVEGFSAAVKTLPEVVWHGLAPATRQQQAATWAGLAADAACCAVRAGEPELAVELLEQGRSMIWTQALNLRADLAALSAAAPELASRLEAARAILNTPGPSLMPDDQPGTSLPAIYPGGPPDTGFHPPRQEDPRARAARDYDETLALIRKLDGFEHYLEPTPYTELAKATKGGAAVIVNASGYGCHAIIVTSDTDRARVVDLPGLDLDAAQERAGQMARLLSNLPLGSRPFPSRDADRRDLLDILSWLWDTIGAPVLDSLPAQEARQRIWWCPTGPLVSLPLHAAGHHPRLRSARDGESVIARTVSSYIPTLTSLARARSLAPPSRIRHLTVATPDLQRPDMPRLRHVSAELEYLGKLFPPGPDNQQLIGSAATRAAVTAGMADHDWLHLACHAGPLDTGDGTVNRGFTLWDCDLTISDLAAQPGHQGGLAFLSACQTATGSDEHLDEALHLAAGMQFIGYSHVVATMWPVKDAPAQLAAQIFYTQLAQAAHDTASALRATTIKLRDTDPTNPFIWAPHAHYGY
jgi:CHAT domain-containing protein